VGGNGNRVLRLAAAAAEVVAFTGAAYDPAGPAGLRILTADRLAERVAFFAEAAGDRDGQVERNLLLQRVLVTPDRDAAIRTQAPRVPHLTVDELLDVPLLLVGTLNQIVDQVRAQRDRYGVSYLTVLEPDMEAFAPVIEALSGT
jgi:alkanesulfonate monooxygenase SsuD/methylene tetrahydromethanopterin reductase-like flavin-dependent oxidoreductase (luciferase family)